jgi:hypothetical protein
MLFSFSFSSHTLLYYLLFFSDKVLNNAVLSSCELFYYLFNRRK